MTNINLLPWREELKEKRKRDYLSLLVAVFIVSCVLVYGGLSSIELVTSQQQTRNELLQNEINALNKQIAEIQKIRKQKKNIEQRTSIILDLQESRNMPTHILDELVRVVPAGVYLSSIDKKGSVLWIQGISESNNHVANMMRMVDISPWLNEAAIESIIASKNTTQQFQKFNLNITVKPHRDIAH